MYTHMRIFLNKQFNTLKTCWILIFISTSSLFVLECVHVRACVCARMGQKRISFLVYVCASPLVCTDIYVGKIT